MKRLAFFAYYFPPLGGAGSQRALSFATHLPPLGWDLTVVTPREGVYGRDPTLVADGLPGVRVVRTASLEPSVLLSRFRGEDGGGGDGAGRFVEDAKLGTLGDIARSAARRFLYFPDSARGWVHPAVAAARRLHRDAPFDLVLSSSPPLSAHEAARRFARAAGLAHVMEFRDLPFDGAGEPGGRQGRFLRGILAEAARVVTVTPLCAEWFDSRLGGATSVVVMNGFEPGEAPAAPAGPPGPFLVYAGSTYAARQRFEPFLGVLERLRASGAALALRIAGRVDPETRERLEPFRARGAVSLEGFLDRRAAVALQASAAAVLVWAWEGEDAVGRSQVPAKLFDGAAAGRPVLLVASEGSDAARVGASLGLRAFPHGDLDGLGAALAALARGEIPRGLVPDRAALAGWTRGAQAARMHGVLEASLSAARRA